jgi:hypothetical protein
LKFSSGYVQRAGRCTGGKLEFRLPNIEIKKLIIYLFAESISSDLIAVDGGTIAMFIPSGPTCIKPNIACSYFIFYVYRHELRA